MGATARASRSAGLAGIGLVVAAVVFSGVPSGTPLVTAAQDDTPDLLDQFLTVAEAVPLMSPDDILVGEFDLQTALLGDLIGAHARLAAVRDDAQALFIVADDEHTLVADQLAEGARAVMLIEDGYRRLADSELVVPFDSRDELEVAVGTDEPRHLLAQGVDLLLAGHGRFETVLVGLRDAEMTSEQAARYRALVEDAIFYAVHIEPALRKFGQDPTSLVMVHTDRFDPDIAGTAAARWVSYKCVPREAVDALSMQALIAAIESSLGAGLADDCPDLPDAEVLQPGEIPAPAAVPSDAG